MNYKIRELQPSSKIITSTEVDLEGISRREFLIMASIAPFTIFPTQSDAFFHVLVARLFARAVRKFIGGAIKPRIKPRGRVPIKKGNENVSVQRAREVSASSKASDKTNHERNGGFKISDILDYQELLANQVWNPNTNNEASIIISNPESYSQNTKDITVELYDQEHQNVDVHARIKPIDIPPHSNLILDMNFKDLPNEGLKRLNGTYGNNQQAGQSGKILVTRDSYGKSINELYKRYEQEHRGNGSLHPSIII